MFSEESLKLAHSNLGYPMVIKNRYGAGGNSVFIINSERELENFYKLSTFNFFNLVFAKYLADLLSKRIFYYHTINPLPDIMALCNPPPRLDFSVGLGNLIRRMAADIDGAIDGNELIWMEKMSLVKCS